MTEEPKPEIYMLTFDLHIFNQKFRPIMRKFFDGEIEAPEAAHQLKQNRGAWNHHLAGLFNLGLNPAYVGQGPIATLTRKEEERREFNLPGYQWLTLNELEKQLDGSPTKHIMAVWNEAKKKED